MTACHTRIRDGDEALIAEDDFEQAIVDTLGGLANLQTTAVEGGGIDVVPGAYGPNCAQHVALETVDWWRVATVEDSTGTPRGPDHPCDRGRAES